jgi:uncharacterized protein (DUF885 family)
VTIALTRPDPAPTPGPLDDRLYDLVEARFMRFLRDNPTVATYLGIHDHNHRLADGSREAVLDELASERAHLAAIEALDPADLSTVEHSSLERPNARAEVHRYTHTPTYQLSYLLGKVLILQLRAEEQRRLGDRFSLPAFHDALLRNGSIPISFQRRLLREAAGPAA